MHQCAPRRSIDAGLRVSGHAGIPGFREPWVVTAMTGGRNRPNKDQLAYTFIDVLMGPALWLGLSVAVVARVCGVYVH